MKISEALELNKGGRFEIPDADRGDLPEFFKEMGYKVGAEIGVYKGNYTRQFLNTGLKMYAIDPWACYEDYDSTKGKEPKRQEALYQEARVRIGKGDCTIIRKQSMDAVKDFKNESLDFVYIDGHHGFKYIAEDIWEWSKKVRKGGVIAGHDYGVLMHKKPMRDRFNNHVRYVVDAYTLAAQIEKWYVIGRRIKLTEDEKHDQWRSWFWIQE